MNDIPKGRDVAVPPGTALAFRDYPRLVFNAPYFTQNPLAEMFAPAVLEAAMQVIPGVLETSTLLQDTVDAEVRRLAVMRTGDTMSGPLFFADPLPTQDSQAASKLYVDMMAGSGGGGGIDEVPLFPVNEIWARVSGSWLPISGLLESGGIPEPGLGNWLRSPGAWVEGMPINGGVFRGTVTLNANAVADTMQPVTMAQLQALLAALDTSGTGPDLTGFMPMSGGAFTGAITLSGDATLSMNPVTLQQLNARAGNVMPLVNATPGVIGISLLYARQDHVHPTDTSRLALTGGTVSGLLTLTGNAAVPPDYTGVSLSTTGHAIIGGSIAAADTVAGTNLTVNGGLLTFTGYNPDQTPGSLGHGFEFGWNGNFLSVRIDHDEEYMIVTETEAGTFWPGALYIQDKIAVNGNGIEYHRFAPNHLVAFQWNGTQLRVLVDGIDIGAMQLA